MAALPTTDRGIDRLRPTDRPVDYRDGGFHRGGGSLFLRVAPSGRKRWYFLFNVPTTEVRSRGDAYPRATIAGDLFPHTGLEAARTWAADLRAHVLAGRDPRRLQRPPDRTLGDLVEEYGRRVGSRTRSWPHFLALYRRHVAGWGRGRLGVTLAELPIADLGTGLLVDCLDEVVEGGAPASANQLRARLSPVLRWARQRGYVEVNPLAGLPLPAPKRSRDRTLTSEEIVAFWRIAEGLAPHRASWGLRLVLVTAQRPGEVLCFEPGELDWQHVVNLPDGSRWTGPVWIIPRDKHKTGRRLIAAGKADQARDHVVPLSSLAADLFRAALEHPRSRRYPMLKTPPPPSANPTFHAEADLEPFRGEAGGMAHWTPRDLRRTAYTGMTALGLSRDLVEVVVNHAVRGVAGTYDRYPYLRERARALNKWARHLEAKVSGRAGEVARIG